VKLAMAVIEPDMQTLVRQCLLNDDIRGAIMVDVKSRDCQSGFVGFESQLVVVASGDVKLDSKGSLAVQTPGIEQDRAIRFLIIVEVCGGQPLV
jgi:hypothetical protein